MLSEQQKQLLDRLLDNDLNEQEHVKAMEILESDPAAVEWLADRALMHAQLRRSMQRRGMEDESQFTQHIPKSVHDSKGTDSSWNREKLSKLVRS
jgi:hypothetical protein